MADRKCVSHKLLVGLEIHVQLATATKMFTAAPNLSGAMKAGGIPPEPNTAVDPQVLGLPGTLLAASLTGAPVVQSEAKSELNLALRERMLTFIENHLPHPDLGPELLMQRFRISRAHLYRAFAEDGGIVGVIRDKRLHAAFRALVDPRKASRSAAGIAGDFGFSNAAKFQKAFLTRFGITPDEARQQGRSVASATDDADLSNHFATYGTMHSSKPRSTG